MSTQPPSTDRRLEPIPPAYPPLSDSYGGFPSDQFLYKPPPKRRIEGVVTTLMTVLAVVALFVVLVVALKNIAPNSPTDLVPEQTRPTAIQEDISGDDVVNGG